MRFSLGEMWHAWFTQKIPRKKENSYARGIFIPFFQRIWSYLAIQIYTAEKKKTSKSKNEELRRNRNRWSKGRKTMKSEEENGNDSDSEGDFFRFQSQMSLWRKKNEEKIWE